MKKILPLALLFVLTGCGGGGTATAPVSKLTVTTGVGYNGATGELAGDPTSNVTSEATTVFLTEGTRTVRILIPNELINVGSTIAFDAAGSAFRYTETRTGTTDTARWTATSGSIRITKIIFGEADIQVSALGFSPLNDGSTNLAQGTFTTSGKLYRVSIL